jgi:hypothetical protein
MGFLLEAICLKCRYCKSGLKEGGGKLPGSGIWYPVIDPDSREIRSFKFDFEDSLLNEELSKLEQSNKISDEELRKILCLSIIRKSDVKIFFRSWYFPL